MLLSVLPKRLKWVSTQTRSKKRNETLQIISSAGKQLNGLNGDILDNSTIEAGQVDLDIDKASPSVVVMQTLPFIKHLIEKNQVIVTRNFQFTKDMSVVSARLSQILLNFLSNAAK